MFKHLLRTKGIVETIIFSAVVCCVRSTRKREDMAALGRSTGFGEEGKDQTKDQTTTSVLIVGAGPSGLATAACLTSRSIPFVILEREDCTASLWKNLTYDCLHLHLPKESCELPLLPFPKDYPKYPSRDQTVAYFDHYARHFDIRPVFNTTVTSAEFFPQLGTWVVTADQTSETSSVITVHFTARFLVVATGENGEPVEPIFPGHAEFRGKSIHGSSYKNGSRYENQKVLVVGIGNTGMEIALDLAKSGAKPTLVARGRIHVLPRDVFGSVNVSTFEVYQFLLKVLPLWAVDKILVLLSWLTLGSTAKFNIVRPAEGPMALKARTGGTPVLDVGTFAKIKSGEIKVMPAIDRLTATGARFVNEVEEDFDAIIMATGYASTVCKWLKDDGMFGGDGLPKVPYPNGWKGELGLYAAGFGRRGLFGCAHDAVLVAQEISQASHDHHAN